MTKVSDITAVIEKYAPLQLAEAWDPVGLQIGDPNQKVNKVLLCLDLTMLSTEKSIELGVEMVITHHPLIFSPIKSVCADQKDQKIIYQLIRNNISVYSAHTNLDAAVGGVADSLAESLQLDAEAWFTVIPDHNFLPGQINSSSSDRIDIIAGHGRYARLKQPIEYNVLRRKVIDRLGSSGCRINMDHNHMIKKIAVFPGSFDEMWIGRLIELGIDAIITGECKHHITIELAQNGISLLEAGHDVTERVVLNPLSIKLENEFKQISFVVDTGLDYNKMAF